jgi:Carboxypeptidase regulatory-like domain
LAGLCFTARCGYKDDIAANCFWGLTAGNGWTTRGFLLWPSRQRSTSQEPSTDSSGGTVPNATVKVTEVSTGTVRTTATSTDGVYNVPYLNPGTYRIEVEAVGFKKFSQDNVRLDVSTTARLEPL